MTLPRATLFAAAATALQALIYFVQYVVPLFSLPGPLPLTISLLIPSSFLWLTLWPAFFFSLYREYSGVPTQMPSRRIAILIAVVLTVTYVAEQITSNVIYPTWVAELHFWVLGVGMLFAWLAFFVAYWAGPEQPRVPKIAKVLAVLVALTGLYGSRGTFSVWLAAMAGRYTLQWRYHPIDAAWQTVIRPGVPILVWVSEAVFLWLFWKTPPPTERTPLN